LAPMVAVYYRHEGGEKSIDCQIPKAMMVVRPVCCVVRDPPKRADIIAAPKRDIGNAGYSDPKRCPATDTKRFPEGPIPSGPEA